MSGKHEFHFLLVSQREGACSAIQEVLNKVACGRTVQIEPQRAVSDALPRVAEREYDLVLLDEDLNGDRRSEFLNQVQARELPLVLLDGHGGGKLSEQTTHMRSRECPESLTCDPGTLAELIRCSLCIHKRETQRRVAEQTLRKLSRAVEQSADLVIITSVDGSIEYVNPAFESLTGYSREEVLGKQPSILRSGVQSPAFYKELWETILSGKVFRGTLVNKKKSGENFHSEKTITPVRDPWGKITHFISNDRDITERKRLEAQLLQATKMDAIGQLAGGVAHDFNNLLMVISSYAELALDTVAPAHPLRHNLEEILTASRHAADLTRQLLAFSRKQMQTLQILDLNNVLRELGRMLPRLIGEDIQLTISPGRGLGKIKADPVQMEQIIMNLAANARDAMPQGGKLTIETSNLALDEEYVHRRPIVAAGEYVLLTVTDTGTGIPPEHLPHIFEPFFTTKEKGKGTGLGLATVYGIVKQTGGYIWVYSEAGMGTTFKVYLPRAGGVAKQNESTVGGLRDVPKGWETILLAEDEDAVRRASTEFLTVCGYKVLEARDGSEAISIANTYAGPIHLLVTDVVMPHFSGSQVAQHVGANRPEMRVLYVSGYAAPTLLQHGVHTGETMFLQKPFTLKTLGCKIRQALTAPAGATAAAPVGG